MKLPRMDSDEHDLLEMSSQVFKEHVAAEVDGDPTFQHELWASLSELGLANLTAPESAGGSEASWRQAGLVLDSAARLGIHTPIAEHDLLAGWLLRTVDEAQQATSLDTFGWVGTNAWAELPWAAEAEAAVLVRRSDDDGSWLWARVERSAWATGQQIGGAHGARLAWTDLSALPWLELPDHVGEQVLLRGALVRSIQVAAALEGMVEMSIDHATVRHQFGKPLMRFQAVQKLIADIAAESTLASAAVARALDLADTAPREIDVAVAKSCVGHAAEVVARGAHQVHGAIGTTREHRLHRLASSVYTWRNDFGGASWWDGWLAQRLASEAPAEASVWNIVTAG
jgi:acyl-CoA dehydrogenase